MYGKTWNLYKIFSSVSKYTVAVNIERQLQGRTRGRDQNARVSSLARAFQLALYITLAPATQTRFCNTLGLSVIQSKSFYNGEKSL